MEIEALKGKTIERIRLVKIHNEVEEIIFETKCGKHYLMYHEQDCCESTYLDDIYGDLKWLLDSPVLQAEESTNSSESHSEYESCTWTFYKLATMKGYVTLRWVCESNGYYSEEISFIECPEDHEFEYYHKIEEV